MNFDPDGNPFKFNAEQAEAAKAALPPDRVRLTDDYLDFLTGIGYPKGTIRSWVR